MIHPTNRAERLRVKYEKEIKKDKPARNGKRLVAEALKERETEEELRVATRDYLVEQR